MLLEIAQAIVADVKARHSEGDCPTTRQHNVGNLEDALLTIAALAKPASEPAGGGVQRLHDLEEAILACERGTMSDVLANYRTVRRTIQDIRALSSPASSSPAEAEQAGVEAVAAIIAKWVDEKRFADAPAFRMAAREIIALLSSAPAQASVEKDK